MSVYKDFLHFMLYTLSNLCTESFPFLSIFIGSFLCSDLVLYSSYNLLLSKNKRVLVLVHVSFLQYRVLIECVTLWIEVIEKLRGKLENQIV